MKKIIFALLIISNYSAAQSLDVRYESTPIKTPITNKSDEQKLRSLDIDLSKLKFVTILHYSQGISIYSNSKSQNATTIFVASDENTIYKNQITNITLTRKNILNKKYIIVDTLRKRPWKLQLEEKKIGDYICKKALYVKKNGTIITAWYCSDIPINEGPEEYWGLPGLILEINDNKANKTITCSMLRFDPKGKQTVEIPSNGEKITPKQQWDIIQKFGKKNTDGTYSITN